ncbi:hypothetical protein H6G00_00595 [Leptolyngbya sp. FACHB-541]|uniref:hypothetical protein n=1 Tax=Leptolyngbya sp. FACHB-541 TaxID=2692810 RepID=UPI001685F6EB|nr:hypothetical protein [Leptolyngbya sp. FACHB-541]MBD1995127.1 hypothetical protein [Leptolyngbya sp. FACHB-541]
MHEISDKTLQVARNHALLAKQHGEQVRNIANHLGETGRITEAHREQVENCADLMLQSAQGMLDAIDAAYKYPKNSVKAYTLAIEHHIQANQYHMIANNLLIEYWVG